MQQDALHPIENISTLASAFPLEQFIHLISFPPSKHRFPTSLPTPRGIQKSLSVGRQLGNRRLHGGYEMRRVNCPRANEGANVETFKWDAMLLAACYFVLLLLLCMICCIVKQLFHPDSSSYLHCIHDYIRVTLNGGEKMVKWQALSDYHTEHHCNS